jgi:hypothetical protein
VTDKDLSISGRLTKPKILEIIIHLIDRREGEGKIYRNSLTQLQEQDIRIQIHNSKGEKLSVF